MVLIAARECALAGSHTLDTLQKLLDSWKDKGLTTPEAVEQYIRKVRELDTFLYSVYEACGHTGRPTAADRALAASAICAEDSAAVSPKLSRKAIDLKLGFSM